MFVSVHRGYVYRIEPISKEIETYFLQCFGADRKIYNLHVEHLYQYLEQIDYQPGDKIDKKAIQMPTVAQLKKMLMDENGVAYLYLVDAYASNEAKNHFFTALSRYNDIAYMKQYKKSALKRKKTMEVEPTFRDLKGMPKFHSKKNNDFSYTTYNQNDNIFMQDGILHLPTAQKSNLKEVTAMMTMHRPLPKDSTIKNVTISMNAKGQFFASICVQFVIEVTDIDTPTRNLGLDYSQVCFFVDSEGKRANYPLFMQKMGGRLVKEQQKLARQVQGSKRWERQRNVVASLHIKVANQRKDWLHKKAYALANSYDMIVLEDMDLRFLSQNTNFAKKQQDNGFGNFRLYLKYKLEQRGKVFLKAPKTFASTQICSHCGVKNTDLKGIKAIRVREWECPNCDSHHDRDINAAINLKRYGEKQYLATVVA